jgi:carboxymethylenebutenolidase
MTEHVTEEREVLADWADLPGGGGIRGYVARPAGTGRHPGVVLGHQLFGVDEPVRRFARRLAGVGYTAVVPDLYHRDAPGVELPADDNGRRRGFELLHGLRREEVVRDVAAAMRYLRETPSAWGPVGMVGLSMGGHVAYLAACRLDLAGTAVLFPGWLTGTGIGLSQPEPTLTLTPGISGRLLFLVGADDQVVPATDREQIADELRSAEVHHEIVVYPDTPHAFFLAGAPTYRAGAADDAWKRILALLAETVGAPIR